MKRIATFVLSSCVLFSSMFGVSNKAAAANVKAPEVKIAVFSDPHYYAPQLGTSGKAFEDYLAGDRKLLAESEAILEETINSIKKSDAQIVLVSGDLTKDGEMVSHTGFANYLKDLEKNGKKVYVIAGNHDINNPDAVKFQGDKTTKVARASASDFKRIYANYGYKEAISRDPYSLSYVVEPVKGLWILVMDSALYNTNLKDGHPTTGGAFSQKRLDWIKTQLKRAKEHHKVVLGMTHHGVVQHFSLQEELFSDYVISDWDEISSDLLHTE